MNNVPHWCVFASLILLASAMLCSTFRILRGPRAQDRVLGFDSLSSSAMLMLLVLGIRTAGTHYFEAALIVALLGFVGTLALAKFLLRGEVIE